MKKYVLIIFLVFLTSFISAQEWSIGGNFEMDLNPEDKTFSGEISVSYDFTDRLWASTGFGIVYEDRVEKLIPSLTVGYGVANIGPMGVSIFAGGYYSILLHEKDAHNYGFYLGFGSLFQLSERVFFGVTLMSVTFDIYDNDLSIFASVFPMNPSFSLSFYF